MSAILAIGMAAVVILASWNVSGWLTEPSVAGAAPLPDRHVMADACFGVVPDAAVVLRAWAASDRRVGEDDVELALDVCNAVIRGKLARAQDHLRQAERLLREIGMTP